MVNLKNCSYLKTIGDRAKYMSFFEVMFFEVCAAEINIFDQIYYFSYSALYLRFMLVFSKITYSHGEIFWKLYGVSTGLRHLL